MRSETATLSDPPIAVLPRFRGVTVTGLRAAISSSSAIIASTCASRARNSSIVFWTLIDTIHRGSVPGFPYDYIATSRFLARQHVPDRLQQNRVLYRLLQRRSSPEEL